MEPHQKGAEGWGVLGVILGLEGLRGGDTKWGGVWDWQRCSGDPCEGV